MTQHSDLVNLARLSAVKLDAEQAKMAETLRRETSIRESLANLDRRRQSRFDATIQADDTALIAGADIRWHQWIDQRRIVLNTELAQVLALKDGHKKTLRTAFGRDQAINTIKSRAAKARDLSQKRKSDYMS